MKSPNSDTDQLRSNPDKMDSNRRQSVDSLVSNSEKRNGGYDKPSPEKRQEIPSQRKGPGQVFND